MYQFKRDGTSFSTSNNGTQRSQDATGFTNGSTYTFTIATWSFRNADTADQQRDDSNTSIILSWTNPNDTDIDCYEYQQKAGASIYGP